MKNLIVIVCLFASSYLKADLIVKMPIKEYLTTEMDMVYELKTDHYQKITLDCLGFVKGLRFYHNNTEERLVYMDEDLCEETNQYLSTSFQTNEPVCMELNANENSILFSKEMKNCQED